MIKYNIKYSKNFKKQLKKVIKQGKNIDKLLKVVELLSNGETLDVKYKDHPLIDNKYYRDCRECHIEPDWLLVYKITERVLVLTLCIRGRCIRGRACFCTF